VRSASVLKGLEWSRLSDHSPLVADLELLPGLSSRSKQEP
jgi:endonuclease/exonuclease/phosphatase family metal-dependent hydrolase